MGSTAGDDHLQWIDSSRRFGCRRVLTLCVILLLCSNACLARSTPPQDASRQAAIGFEQQGDFSQAEAAWRTYLADHPSSAEAYAHLGLLAARQEHYREAEPLYRKAMALGSTIPGLRLDLGLALFKTGDLQQALTQFTPLLNVARTGSADRQRLSLLVGMCYYGLGQYRQAASHLQEVVSGDPNNLPLLLALTQSYLWSKQYSQVLVTYRQILILNPQSAEADLLAGEALDAEKDAFGAMQQFRAAIKADPHLPEAHFGLGYILWTQHQIPAAAAEFQAELDNNPNYAQTLAYLGDCDLVLNHPELARPLLQRAIQSDPRIELAPLDLGMIDANAGRRKDALRELLIAEGLAPNDLKVHWQLGRIYRELGDREKAAAEFNKVKTITAAVDTPLVKKMMPPSSAAQPVPASGR